VGGAISVATTWPVTRVQAKTGSGVAGTGLAGGGRRASGAALTLQAAERASGPAREELGRRRTGWGRRGGGGHAGVGQRRIGRRHRCQDATQPGGRADCGNRVAERAGGLASSPGRSGGKI
jgi:hypothetical protein